LVGSARRASKAVWRPRYDLINDFERLLTLSGTTVLKIFLHISKADDVPGREPGAAEGQRVLERALVGVPGLALDEIGGPTRWRRWTRATRNRRRI
jgi:hypothetical protein